MEFRWIQMDAFDKREEYFIENVKREEIGGGGGEERF